MVIVLVAIGVGAFYFLPSNVLHPAPSTQTTTSSATSKQNACANSGGIIDYSNCCKSASDFPNNCAIGACGCSLENSHQVKVCQCPAGKCWDGNSCVSPETQTTTTSQVPIFNNTPTNSTATPPGFPA